MSFSVQTRTQPGVTGRDPTLCVLADDTGNEAVIWPALGFNCFHWRAPCRGRILDLLFADAALFADGRPTRSGIPVLFPFPNRIRAGRFAWAGKEYQLPCNDSNKANAIHGFACRSPWRVTGSGANADSAWWRGVWRCSKDAPDCLPLWPADHEIELTYRLGAGRLRIEAEVRNPDRVPLPFGLGYHPYFSTPPAAAMKADDCLLCAPAQSFWVLQDSLPTGTREPVSGDRDLNRSRPVSSFHLDDILTDLPALTEDAGGLRPRAMLSGDGFDLSILWSDLFRDMVIFTPPHRRAVCVEPYTCPTDAVNLAARGMDVGWQVLPPGGRWSAVVECRLTPRAD
jgi:aldose 1-epimerase